MPKIIKTKISGDKKKRRKYSKGTLYFISASKGFIVALIGLFIISFLLYKNNNFTFFNKMIIYLAVSLGGFISGLSAHNNVKGRGFADGLISSSLYVTALLLLLIIILKLNFSAHLLILYPVALISGFIGGIAKA